MSNCYVLESPDAAHLSTALAGNFCPRFATRWRYPQGFDRYPNVRKRDAIDGHRAHSHGREEA